MITYAEFFAQHNKEPGFPIELTELVDAKVAKIPKGTIIFPIFYTSDTKPTTLPDITKLSLITDIVETTNEWIIRDTDVYKVTQEMLSKTKLDLPIEDYKDALDTYIPQVLQILLTKLPEIHYKEDLRRVYVGFIFFVTHLTPYEV